MVAVLVAVSFFTESIFDSRASVGTQPKRSASSILPPLLGVTLYAAFFIVVFGTLVDLAYAWLDPRIRVE